MQNIRTLKNCQPHVKNVEWDVFKGTHTLLPLILLKAISRNANIPATAELNLPLKHKKLKEIMKNA